jgi:hypothetical protein
MPCFPHHLRVFASLTAAVVLGLVSLPKATAQTSNIIRSNTIFEDVRVTPASRSTTVRGISGGDNSATQLMGRSQTATGPCLGFVDEQPDHRMELTNNLRSLSLQVQSTADTTLVIRGPGGIWCNDNYGLDFNPGIAGEWLPGVYEIWVGSHRVNRYYPYIIEITNAEPSP